MSRRGILSGALFDFERRNHAMLSAPEFIARLWHNFVLAMVLVGGSLLVGMAGYRWLEHLGWTDSFLNASMLLSGMGPLWSPRSEAGKVFAGFYALYSGLAVLAIASLMLAPLAHRLLHHFHAADDDPSAGEHNDSDPGTPASHSKPGKSNAKR